MKFQAGYERPFVRGDVLSVDRVAVTAAEKRDLREATGAVGRRNGIGRGGRESRANGACRFAVCARFPIPRRRICRSISIAIATRTDGFARTRIALAAMARPFTVMPA